MPPILFLYDGTGRILWCSRTEPPYKPKDVIGQQAWHALVGGDAVDCQAAIVRALATGEHQTFDSRVVGVGTWRTTLHPVRRMGRVKLVGCSARVPPAVLTLTARERQVARLVADGLLAKEIAKRLCVAASTVNNHRSNIARKVRIRPPALDSWCGQHRAWL
jgi:DNA-binding NarL/FixJ family response regulator